MSKNKKKSAYGTVTFEILKTTPQDFILQSADKRKLNGYLAEIEKQAENMFYQLVKELAEKENVTDQLKLAAQMLWVQKMNNIRNRATEIVNKEIIYSI